MTNPYRHLLTDKQAQVLELRLQGHSWRTIARVLNINHVTVRDHHQAALERINRERENT